jgi:hypothetical protein
MVTQTIRRTFPEEKMECRITNSALLQVSFRHWLIITVILTDGAFQSILAQLMKFSQVSFAESVVVVRSC